MTLNVNLIAGPGIGKSVVAASLFVKLKLKGIHAELVREYAKELVYADRIHETSQLDIFQEQLSRQALLQGKAQVVITDAPLDLSYVYSPVELHPEIAEKMRQGTKGWRHLHVLLHRDLTQGYEAQGRYQSAAQAQQFHQEKVVPFSRNRYQSELVECPVEVAETKIVQRILEQLNA